MQTLRKKSSPLKYKNETTKFLGDGMTFKAKLIGILEVSEARGDRMCQDALSDLKMAIRAAGEHKQRIIINIAIDGLRLRDEKTGDSLYHHPVHKISFICQDMTDSRAFGYIFGSPDTGHRFFGIKTDKAANQVVIAMRDLFQVVFALKKKEVEIAKQHLDKNRYTNSPLFSDSSINSSKSLSQETAKIAANENKAGASSETKSGGTAVADLVDLELELNSLQQGINQMERITPSDPFGTKDDPFGDSFTSYTKPILPPPPSSGRERSSRSSDSSSVLSPKTQTNLERTSNESLLGGNQRDRYKTDKNFTFSSEEQPSSAEWFTPSIFEEPPLMPEPPKDEKHELAKKEIMSQFDVFTELDPLGTGRSRPYIDKKHFFQELKNPPKKVLNDLVSQSQEAVVAPATVYPSKAASDFDPFGEDPFVTEDPFADFSKQDPFETEFGADFKNFTNKQNNLDRKGDVQSVLERSPKTTRLEKQISIVSRTSPRNTLFSKQNSFDVQFEPFEAKTAGKLMQLHENPSLDMSSESECAPEPPPRPATTLTLIKPPPLPPKKQANDLSVKRPPRPPPESHYDYMDNYGTASAGIGADKTPPIPVPQRKAKFESDFVPERPKKFNLSDEDYLTPISGVANQPLDALNPKSKKQVTVETFLDGKHSGEENSLDGLDITLSQLTLSGLNELATKLNIPANQLSNMTLVQLTNFLANFIKTKSTQFESNEDTNTEYPGFKADFAANFNNANHPNTSETYDRYAVFRELMKEEIKQTKIDTEPEELQEEKEKLANIVTVNNINNKSLSDTDNSIDKYAALREIVESELKVDVDELKDDNKNECEDIQQNNDEETNIINLENKFIDEDETKPQYNIIEYNAPIENEKNDQKSSSPKTTSVKSPLPIAVTEIIQTNTRVTSGSLSDVISGSSPEVDNTASNSEVGKKESDVAGESWAIFDQANIASENKDKQTVQSEEGVSPWSSDSKEYGNGSPTEWRREGGSADWGKRRRVRKGEEGWWDTSAEPELQYYPSNRRSTDSYEDEYYECYEKPRRRKVNYHSGQASGGHSSSSRDVSPWEEEPRRRQGWTGRHPRPHNFEKPRRHTDSWDDEDDYEYEGEHVRRFHRHDGREERWGEDWGDERMRHRRRRDMDRERWCCPDWDPNEHEKFPNRYGSGRWVSGDTPPSGAWRDRKHDERYYSRDSHESPWEDDYSNEAEEVPSPHYLTAKRNWKRPSSASEIDRKTGEIKTRHYLGPGGSDGERDRRYKPGRRSRSRDSQYSEQPAHRHKQEQQLSAVRNLHRKPHKTQFEEDYAEVHKKSEKVDHSNKKSSTLARKKKDSPKTEETATFPRKKGKSLFENDFVGKGDCGKLSAKFNFENDFETSEAESPTVSKCGQSLQQFATVENKTVQSLDEYVVSKETYKPRLSFNETKLSPRVQKNNKSMFEDDFSPSEKSEIPEDNSISSIKEEIDPNEEEDSFGTNNFDATNTRRKKINRLSNNKRSELNLKKSESVNIFARENDPFDDDFFSENVGNVQNVEQCKTSDLKWTEDFDDFDDRK